MNIVINFTQNLSEQLNLDIINKEIESACGIVGYFNNIDEIKYFKQESQRTISDKKEYGDWQTNTNLSWEICQLLKANKVDHQVIIEPTCGNGNFIVSALQTFNNIEQIYGIEIHKPYLDQLKLKILDYFLSNPKFQIPKIHLYKANIFNYDFTFINAKITDKELLILGNPPWVTNSHLSSIKSENLPDKSNIKHDSGLSSMTGKANFDISASITLMMLKLFVTKNGHLSFLIKNNVIKNIIHDQKTNLFPISDTRQYNIDAKKEFKANVSASMFFCKLNSLATTQIKVYDLQNTKHSIKDYGWVNSKFVSNIEKYDKKSLHDGCCSLTWWSGVKHDCSRIMDLERIEENKYTNSLGEELLLESQYIYPLLKSSDLKGGIINQTRKYTIITQKKTGEDTSIIGVKCPNTYQYLIKHTDIFNNRGSSIYANKPRFSIFWIGEYSFCKYKIAISGLYKTTIFSLAMPIMNKPTMLDDTCYMLGFNDLTYAKITLDLLNGPIAQALLGSLIFKDAKRPINKDILMRINLINIAKSSSFETLAISEQTYNEYIDMLENNYFGERTLFSLT